MFKIKYTELLFWEKQQQLLLGSKVHNSAGVGGNISSYYHFTFALRGNLSQEAWLYGKCSLLLLYFTNLSHRAIRQWSFIPIAHFKQITCIQNAVAGKKRHYNDFNLLIWFFKFIAAILGCSGVYLSSNVNILYNKKLLL